MDASPRSTGSAGGESRDAAPVRAGPSAAWISLVLGVALHLRQVAYLAELDNRYKIHWQRQDALALGLDIGLTALGIYAVLAGLGRVRRPAVRHLRAPLEVWCLSAAALSILSFTSPPDWVFTVGSALGLALAALCYVAAPEATVRGFARAGIALSPVALVTFVQLAWWSPWGSDPEPLGAVPASGSRDTSAYVFVFDEWSFERSTEDGELRPLLPNLRQVASRSFWFPRAVAPDWDTSRSLPHLLYARDGSWSFQVDGKGTYWKSAEARVPSRDSESLFGPFSRVGYRTALIGFYLPYRRILGPEVDVVRSHPHVPRGTSLLERMQVRGLAGARFLLGSGVASRLGESYRHRYSRHWYEIGESTLRDALHVIRTWPDPTMLVVHWPVPHAPFVFEADGSYRGPFEASRTGGDAADYDRQLRYLDRIVGLILEALREGGRLDRSLLVFTSDHGWKKRDRSVLHVPLIVKWPHQREAERIERPFRTIDLAALLELVAAGVDDPGAARRTLEALLLPSSDWPDVGRGG